MSYAWCVAWSCLAHPAPMIPVAIWSKFPQEYVTSIISPKLNKNNVKVVKTISSHTKECDLSDIVAILFMYEMCGHSEQENLRKRLAHNTKIIPISRKVSTWSNWLGTLETLAKEHRKDMPAPHVVSQDNIQNLLDDYMRYRKSGLSVNDIVPKLAKYWEYGELTNSNQLGQYIRSIVKTGKANKEFVDFYESLKTKKCANKESEEQESTDLSSITPKEEEVIEDESKEWKSIYEEELTKQLDKIKTLEQKVKELEVKQKSTSDFSSILKVDEVVKSGIIQKVDAYDLIMKFCRK